MVLPKRKSTKPLHRPSVEEAATEAASGLPGLIRLANLVPPDHPLPGFPDIKFIHVGGLDMDSTSRERQFRRFLDENFPRDRYVEFREFFDSGSNDPVRPESMYQYLRETREALRMIASQHRNQSLFNSNLHFPWHLVSNWKIDRIRICGVCGKIFFADRNNKLTHGEPCTTTRRVRNWRRNQAQYEQARKLKSARPDKERKPVKHASQGGKNVTQKAR